jgi:hypothetical protein
MAESWLRSYPIAAPDPVPWGWNPAQTFQTAFNNAQENQRAQEEMQMKAELSRILFPQKQAEVEFNLKKLAYESENLTSQYKLLSEEQDAKRRFLRSGGLGGGQGGGGGGNNAPAAPTSRYGGGVADLIKSYQSGGRPAASGGGGKTLGSGLTGDE